MSVTCPACGTTFTPAPVDVRTIGVRRETTCPACKRRVVVDVVSGS